MNCTKILFEKQYPLTDSPIMISILTYLRDKYKYKAKIGWDYSYINYNWDGVLTIRIYVEEYSNLIAEDEIEDLDFYVFELKLLNVG